MSNSPTGSSRTSFEGKLPPNNQPLKRQNHADYRAQGTRVNTVLAAQAALIGSRLCSNSRKYSKVSDTTYNRECGCPRWLLITFYRLLVTDYWVFSQNGAHSSYAALAEKWQVG